MRQVLIPAAVTWDAADEPDAASSSQQG